MSNAPDQDGTRLDEELTRIQAEHVAELRAIEERAARRAIEGLSQGVDASGTSRPHYPRGR